jgi:NitT/TauT family transport system permease protein
MSVADAVEKSRFAPPLLGLLTIVLLVIALEIAIRFGLINEFIVPPPSEVVAAFPSIIVEHRIFARFLDTAYEVAIASILVATLGIGAGIVLYKIRTLRLAVETWIAAMAAAPIVLTYPLFLTIFGRGATMIVVMALITGLAPVTLKTLEGFATIRGVLIDVGRSFNLTPSQQFWKILLPAALPTIFVGVRLGLIFALISIVGMEFLISAGGLGQVINELAERYDLAGTYAAICFVVLISVCVFVSTERIERWLQPSG